jgi:hypothetical protein
MRPLTDPEFSDRRASPRRIFHGSISIGLPEGQVIAGRGIDISASGVGLQCPVNLPTHHHCQLQLSLLLRDGSVHRLNLPGVVMYTVLSGEYGAFKVGVQFESVSAASQHILARYMKG